MALLIRTLAPTILCTLLAYAAYGADPAATTDVIKKNTTGFDIYDVKTDDLNKDISGLDKDMPAPAEYLAPLTDKDAAKIQPVPDKVAQTNSEKDLKNFEDSLFADTPAGDGIPSLAPVVPDTHAAEKFKDPIYGDSADFKNVPTAAAKTAAAPIVPPVVPAPDAVPAPAVPAQPVTDSKQLSDQEIEDAIMNEQSNTVAPVATETPASVPTETTDAALGGVPAPSAEMPSMFAPVDAPVIADTPATAPESSALAAPATAAQDDSTYAELRNYLKKFVEAFQVTQVEEPAATVAATTAAPVDSAETAAPAETAAVATENNAGADLESALGIDSEPTTPAAEPAPDVVAEAVATPEPIPTEVAVAPEPVQPATPEQPVEPAAAEQPALPATEIAELPPTPTENVVQEAEPVAAPAAVPEPEPAKTPETKPAEVAAVEPAPAPVVPEEIKKPAATLSKEDQAYVDMLDEKHDALPKNKQLPASTRDTIASVTPSLIPEKKPTKSKEPERIDIQHETASEMSEDDGMEDVIKGIKGMEISISGSGSDGGINIKDKMEEAYRALLAGQVSASISLYKQILESAPENKDALFGLATAYHRNSQYEQAREIYTKILKKDPNNREVLNNFLVLVAEESPDSAILELEKLERINSDFSPIPAQIAMIYLKTNRPEKAERYLRRAVILSPDNITYKYNLAITSDQLGKYEQAAQLYTQILEAAREGVVVPGTANSIQERLAFLQQKIGKRQ